MGGATCPRRRHVPRNFLPSESGLCSSVECQSQRRGSRLLCSLLNALFGAWQSAPSSSRKQEAEGSSTLQRASTMKLLTSESSMIADGKRLSKSSISVTMPPQSTALSCTLLHFLDSLGAVGCERLETSRCWVPDGFDSKDLHRCFSWVDARAWCELLLTGATEAHSSTKEDGHPLVAAFWIGLGPGSCWHSGGSC